MPEEEEEEEEEVLMSRDTPLWSGTNKNRDVSTGPLARPFACSLAPLTHSLAPDYSLRSRSLCSLSRSWESEFLMFQNHLVLSHSAFVVPCPIEVLSGKKERGK